MTFSVDVKVHVILPNPSGGVSTVIHNGLLCQYEYLTKKVLGKSADVDTSLATALILWFNSSRVLHSQTPHLHLRSHLQRVNFAFKASAFSLSRPRCVCAVPLTVSNSTTSVSRVMAATSCQAWSAVSIVHTAVTSSAQRSASFSLENTAPCCGSSITSRVSLPATTVVIKVFMYHIFFCVYYHAFWYGR